MLELTCSDNRVENFQAARTRKRARYDDSIDELIRDLEERGWSAYEVAYEVTIGVDGSCPQ